MAETPPRQLDPFDILRASTSARIGLGRAGQSLPTAPMLAFQLAHARARDAVHTPLDVARLRAALPSPALLVDSAAADREIYLQNPGLGRRLAETTVDLPKGDFDLAIVIADGLSAVAVHSHAPAIVEGLTARLADWKIAPLVIARQARVAIGDPIGAALGAKMVVIVIGERPGLSAADSVGAYITWKPVQGRKDCERNCVSNIRSPHGLAPDQAVLKINWLLREAADLQMTGTALKDRHDRPTPKAISNL